MKKMEKEKLLSGVMAITMVGSTFAGVPNVMAAQTDLTLESNSDTYVNNNESGAKGALDYAVLGSTTETIPSGINNFEDTTENINIAYLTFDISSVDVNMLDDAILRLKIVENAEAAEGAAVNVFEASESVDENSTTWSSKPKIVDRVKEQDQEDNITVEDAVATGAVNEGGIVINGLGKTIKAARLANKSSITFAVYLNKDTQIKFATRESTVAGVPTLDTSKIDENAISNASALILAVPEVNLNNYNTDALLNARKEAVDAYNALTSAEKAKLDEAAYTKLTTFYDDKVWETTLSEYKNADEIIKAINSIQTSEMTADNYTTYRKQLESIRKSYNEASFKTKAVIGNKTYQLLVNAENKFDGLESLDVDAIKEKIEIIGEVTQDNYLDLGQYIVSAREAYDKFADLMRKSFTDGSGNLDTDSYNKKMSVLAEDLEILEAAEAPIAGYKNVTAKNFVYAWNIIKNNDDLDVLHNNPEKVAEKEDALNEFESGYYSSEFNNLSNSVYYKNFTDGNVTPEVAAAIEEYLSAQYLLSVDIIKAEYGDPTDPGFSDRFDTPDADANLYIYLYEYRAAAEVNYEKLSDASKEKYSAQSDYCDAVYEAMMNLIDAKIRSTLQLDLGEAELTKEYIDAIKTAEDNRDAIPKAIVDYMEKYAPTQYEQYFKQTLELDGRIDDLEKLAQDEVDKYDDLAADVEAYGLNYMSGYTVDENIGTKDDVDKYWNINSYISNTRSTFKSINPTVALGDNEFTTILEYYYDKMLSNADSSSKKIILKDRRDAADAEITSFESHNSAIVELRKVAADCNEKIYAFGLMLSDSDLSELSLLDTQEEVNEKLEEILASKGITVEQFKQAFDELYAKIETDDASYRKLSETYKQLYDFEDIKEPYMSVEDLKKWENIKNEILPAIYPDEEIIAVAQDWVDRLNALYDNVFSIDKEFEYTDNEFNTVYQYQDELEALKEEYDAFEPEVKYYISSSYINSNLENSVSYEKLDEILNRNWPSAIEVMDTIDEAASAILTDEWEAKLTGAENALKALEKNNAAAYEHVAEAAKAKLKQTRFDFDIYNRFELWLNGVGEINYPITEYAQLYTYDNNNEIVPSELSNKIDSLEESESSLYDDLEKASAAIQEYINSSENEYINASMTIVRLVKEKRLALEAEVIDKRIIALDTLNGEEFLVALNNLRNDIDELVSTISYEDEDKRGNDAAIKFNMITQYSKYEEYVNNYDKSIADRFIKMVEDIGNITYTTDLETANDAIGRSNSFLVKLNDAQEKYAYNSIIKLGVLKNKYNRIYAAKEAAQGVLRDINDVLPIIRDTVLVADPYDYEYKKLLEGYSNVIGECAVVSGSIEAIDGTDAYQYLLQNGHIDTYENELAAFGDKYQYIGVIQAIEVLYADSKNVIEITIDEDGNEIITINEEERAILVEETKNVMSMYLALDNDSKQNVLNYSSLQWLVKNIDAARVGAIISLIQALPAVEDITYAKYMGAVASIKAEYDSLLSENQARIQTDDGGATYEKLTNILIKMAMMEEEYGELGGKIGDVNGDDVVDINDIILMVDYAFGTKTVETDEDEKQFLRGNLVKETDVSEEKIDFHDITAVIDLLEFNN